jgi:hypothetical protein
MRLPYIAAASFIGLLLTAPVAAAEMMMDGQTATITAKGDNYPCQGTKEQMDAFISAAVKKDRYGMAESMIPGGVFLQAGMRVRAIGHAGFLGSTMRIRIESGKLAGAACWLPSDIAIFKNVH